jgi:hypothetical protein
MSRGSLQRDDAVKATPPMLWPAASLDRATALSTRSIQ